MIQPAIPSVSHPLPAPEPALDRRFDAVRQMLDDIETTTTAGQSYVMGKVVAFLETELDRRRTILTDRRLSMAARWVEELAHQASRVIPDVHIFSQRVDRLLDTLASTE